jgi:hypothetical protein
MTNRLSLTPARGCIAHYGTQDINSVNDCCYNTCATFMGQNQSDVIQSECGDMCQSAMYDLIRLNQRNPCEFWPEIPVIKGRPTTFLENLKRTGDPNKAFQHCVMDCNRIMPNYPNQCKLQCWMDRSALNISGPESCAAKTVKKSTPKRSVKEGFIENYDGGITNPVPYWIAVAVVALLGFIFVLVFLRAVVGK